MAQETTSSKAAPRSRLPYLAFAVLALALIAGGAWIYNTVMERQAVQQAADIAAAQAETAAAIADRLGISVESVRVTADGGLVDFRYRVIDPDKAIFIFQDLDVVPQIIAEDGTVIALASLPHRHGMTAGITYFILYRNVSGAVKPGSEVTIKVGEDLRLEHIQVPK